MPPVGSEPIISAGERSQNYALDRAATGADNSFPYNAQLCNVSFLNQGNLHIKITEL